MYKNPETIRASVLLTNRLVRLGAKPLVAKEFWRLAEQIDPGELLDLDADGIAERLGAELEEGRRLRTLLDAATAMSFEQERLHDGGTELVSALDERFPSRLRDRLGASCPPFLLVAGPIDRLSGGGLGVVGSRDTDEAAPGVARAAGRLATEHGWTVIGGLASGVDHAAIAAAHDAGGTAVGIPAEGISRAARNADVRRQVHAGSLTIASPYAPDAPSTARNALGRHKIVYALSSITFVVAVDDGSGATWAGATEAIDRRFGVVAVWAGEGAQDGNLALGPRGASTVADPAQLFDLDTELPPPPAPDSLF
jgi:predicted Rossmann fold nucleotide-binding protein DprA/Smf involved in DNA uptake